MELAIIGQQPHGEISSPSPYVRLDREPNIESFLCKGTPPPKNDVCFACGGSPFIQKGQSVRRHMEIIALFKDLVITPPFRAKLSPKTYNQFVANVAACENCCTLVREIWGVRLRLISTQKHLDRLVAKGRETLLISQARKRKRNNITFVASSPQDPIPPEELDALPDVVVKEEVDDDIYFDEVIFPTNSEESDHHQEIQPIIETTESSPSQHEVGHNSDDEPSQILTLDEDKKNFENCQSSKEHPLDYFSSSEHQPKSPSEKIKRRRRRKAKIQRVTHVPLPPPPTKYLCSKCGKEFKTSISLLSHEVTVCKILHDKLYLESRGLKRYECDHCDTKFVSHKDYERHYLRHISVKQHPCHQCGKSFKQIYNLRVHQKSACRQASEIDIAAKNKRLEVGRIIRAKYVHKCPNCSRKFPSTAKRDEHVANVHNETDEKFAICDICGVSISTKGGSGNMREHLSRVHLRVARWTCPHCKKGFFQKRDWASHVERVHGNIPGDKVT